jgi:hypothetical protein
MSTIPKLTEKQIRDRVGERSFHLGQNYFQDGSVFQTRRQGMTLKARCQGSRAAAYLVEVTCNSKGIAEAECSCPVGGGGACKHVAAVLLAWRAQPDQFTEVEELDQALQRRGKEELIALIKQMLRREPDLESLLEMPLPVAGSSGTPPTPDVYRHQAQVAFDHGGNEWGAAEGIADELLAIKEIGDGFLQKDDPAGALAVFQGVVAGVLDNYHQVRDEEGDFHRVIGECVGGLEKCLASPKTGPAQRQAILRTFFDVEALDIEQGGIGLSDCLPDFVEDATPEERRLMANWVRKALAGAGDWGRGAFGRMLLELEADTMDDEAFLRTCRETGRLGDLVDRLLKLRRLQEAVVEAEKASDYELLGLADLFVKHHQGNEAERLVRERSSRSKDSRLLEWLKKRAAGRKDHAATLELAQKIFADRPDLTGFKDIRTLARKLHCWDELRPKLLAPLRSPRFSYALVPILLEEGEIDAALEAVKNEPFPSFGFGYSYGLKMDVAAAAEKTRPRAALEIYRQYAERLINQRGRDSYAAASTLLKKVRGLHGRLDENAQWSKYIAALKEKHRGLPALREEMAKAKL